MGIVKDPESKPDVRFTLDRVTGVPLHLQLERHLEYLICTGIYKEGDRLPSIRILAEKLRLSPGTVRRAYDQLAERRLVAPRQGHGVIVKWSKPENAVVGSFDVELRAILKGPIVRAQSAGFSHEQIVRAILEMLGAQGENVKVVFLAFNEYVATRYAEVLQLELRDIPISITPVTLTAAQAREPAAISSLMSARFIVTQLYHLSDAEELTRGLAGEVLPITVALSRESHTQLEALPRSGKIGIVCPEATAPATFDAIAAYRPDRAAWVYASPSDHRSLAKIRSTCTIAVTTSLSEHASRKLLGESLSTVPLIYIPTPQSMTRLRIAFSRAALSIQLRDENPRNLLAPHPSAALT